MTLAENRSFVAFVQQCCSYDVPPPNKELDWSSYTTNELRIALGSALLQS